MHALVIGIISYLALSLLLTFLLAAIFRHSSKYDTKARRYSKRQFQESPRLTPDDIAILREAGFEITQPETKTKQ